MGAADITMFERRNILDVLLIPISCAGIAALCWNAVYAGPVSADKFEARLEAAARASLDEARFRWAHVEMDGQMAILSGIAPTEQLLTRARNRVLVSSGRGGFFRGGVTRVLDETELLPPVSPYAFSATRHGDRFRLTGILPDPDAMARLEEVLIGEGISPEFIELDVAFRDGVPEGDWIGAVTLGLRQLVKLYDGEVDVTDRRVFVSGIAPNIDVRNDIIAQMARPPSGYSVDADIAGTALWTARLNGDYLIMEGSVPDAADRTALFEYAEQLFDGVVENEMGVVPMRSDDWIRGVRAALPGFLQHESGVMAFMGDELVIEGLATPSVIDFLREDFVRVGVSTDFMLNSQPAPTRLMAFDGLDTETTHPSRDVCAAALEEALSLSSLNFRYARDELARESAPLLDGVLTVLQTCPDYQFVIDAATHADGRRIALKNLTEDRQTAVLAYFIARGVPLDQIVLTEVRQDSAGLPDPVSIDTDRQISVRLRELEDD
ncbi:MAG: hypothetical protein CMK04_15635 [Ponticaulis sp.]|nr:hypothetical protein [Ponticaulis sp.]|tara:strand:- start:12202 stop:13683 length:1482 start_codon:yes stop_codon:yes gene_type:complete